MASGSKKKKVSKAKLKKLASFKGKKSAEKQGKGAGSRKSFSLPAKWSEEHTEIDGKTRLKFVSPCKSEYSSEKAVVQTLAARNLEACFNASSASSEHAESEGSEFFPDMELSDPEKAGCSKSSKAESETIHQLSLNPRSARRTYGGGFSLVNLHSCWISLSKSTGPAVAQHLIAEVRFPFLICFHFDQKIEINVVVWLLMVSATL